MTGVKLDFQSYMVILKPFNDVLFTNKLVMARLWMLLTNYVFINILYRYIRKVGDFSRG